MKKINLISAILFTVFITGCSSTQIPYQEQLKNQVIEAKLYIPALPGAEIKVAGIINAKDEITLNFQNINIKEIVISEFANIPANQQKREKTIIDKKFLSTVTIPLNEKYLEEIKTNPVVSNYNFESIENDIGAKYIMIFNVQRIVYDGQGYSRSVIVDAEVSIHDIAAKTIIWRNTFYGKKMIGLTDGPAKNPIELKAGITETVRMLIENMVKNINSN